jgi:hypothetical protein
MGLTSTEIGTVFDSLDTLFTGGTCPAAFKTDIVTFIASQTRNTDPLRTDAYRHMAWLIYISPYSIVRT